MRLTPTITPLLVVFVVAGCGGFPVDQTGPACAEFRNVARDYTERGLGESELRRRLEAVADRAVGSRVEAEARTLADSMDTIRLGDAVTALDEACAAAGH